MKLEFEARAVTLREGWADMTRGGDFEGGDNKISYTAVGQAAIEFHDALSARFQDGVRVKATLEILSETPPMPSPSYEITGFIHTPERPGWRVEQKPNGGVDLWFRGATVPVMFDAEHWALFKADMTGAT